MDLVYALEQPRADLSRSIFLAGPSPRGKGEYDWRKVAISYLYKVEFMGTIFVPLPRDSVYHDNYDSRAQALWEISHLEKAAVRMFWIPRDLVSLPGFTTNVEFGRYSRTPPCFLGHPPDAPKTKYLDLIAEIDGVPVFDTLEETLRAAIHALPA